MLNKLTRQLTGFVVNLGPQKGPTRIPRLDFNDVLAAIRLEKRMRFIKGAMKLLPGIGAQVPPDSFDNPRIEAMILSMTPKERSYPETIDQSRCRRIARGSGTSVEDVRSLLYRTLSA